MTIVKSTIRSKTVLIKNVLKYDINESIIINSPNGTFQTSKCLEDGKNYLVKKIIKVRIPDVPIEDSRPFEYDYQPNLDHPNIMAVKRIYEDSTHLYVCTLVPPGVQLSHFLKSRKDIPMLEIKTIIMQILNAVEYLNKNNLQHRNLNSETIFIEYSTLKISLIEFSACAFKDTVFHVHNYSHMLFTAPEVFSGSSDYKIDSWAIGIMMYLLMYNESPYDIQMNSKAMIEMMVSQGAIQNRRKRAKKQDPVLELLLEFILERDPAQRPMVSEILEHPLFLESVIENKSYLANHPYILNIMDFSTDSLAANIIVAKCDFFETENLITLFNMITNGGTQISINDIEQIFELVFTDRAVAELKAKSVVDCYDINGNGQIDFFEFKLFCYSFGLEELCEISKRFSNMCINEKGYIKLSNFFDALQIIDKKSQELIMVEILNSLELNDNDNENQNSDSKKDLEELNILDIVDLLILGSIHETAYKQSDWYFLIQSWVYSSEENKAAKLGGLLKEFVKILGEACRNSEEDWKYSRIKSIRNKKIEQLQEELETPRRKIKLRNFMLEELETVQACKTYQLEKHNKKLNTYSLKGVQKTLKTKSSSSRKKDYSKKKAVETFNLDYFLNDNIYLSDKNTCKECLNIDQDYFINRDEFRDSDDLIDYFRDCEIIEEDEDGENAEEEKYNNRRCTVDPNEFDQYKEYIESLK